MQPILDYAAPAAASSTGSSIGTRRSKHDDVAAGSSMRLQQWQAAGAAAACPGAADAISGHPLTQPATNWILPVTEASEVFVVLLHIHT